jgi:calmodulin
MDIQQAFKLFCRGKEKLNPRDLGTVIQSLGRNLPKARLEGMLKKVDSKSDGIDFGQFLGLLAQSENDRDSEGEIREAFKIFDQSNCGTISVMELQRIMTSLGEKLSNEEFDEMVYFSFYLVD